MWIKISCVVTLFLIFIDLTIHFFEKNLNWLSISIDVLTGSILVFFLYKVFFWKQRKSRRINQDILLERKRIAQDLHDTVGVHLSRALAACRLDHPENLITIESLHLADAALRTEMHVMDDIGIPVNELLSNLRWRLIPLLELKGIKLHWKVPLNIDFSFIKTDDHLILFYIISESINNAIKHSKAKNIDFSIDESDSNYIFIISDDGVGFENKLDKEYLSMKSRFGLEGMKKRAEKIGAKMDILSNTGSGVQVILNLKK